MRCARSASFSISEPARCRAETGIIAGRLGTAEDLRLRDVIALIGGR